MSIIPVNEALSIKAAKLKEFNDGSSARLKEAEDRFNINVKGIKHDTEYVIFYKTDDMTKEEMTTLISNIEAAGYFVYFRGYGMYCAYLTKPKRSFFGTPKR